MKRVLAIDTPSQIGKEVKVLGWVNTRRDHGKIVFIDLRDRSGIVQVVLGEEAGELSPEDVLEVYGEVQKRPQNMVNPNIETGEVEIKTKSFKILSKAASLPFDLFQKDLDVSLPTLLDNRSLTLRNEKISAIFEVEEEIARSFRETMRKLDFKEIFVPTIVAGATEGGAEVFKINYYNHDAYLAQSPQLYKQIMVSVFERVFTIAHAYRAEPSYTTRHLTEYVSLDCEMGFLEYWEDLMDTCEEVIRDVGKNLVKNNKKELELFGVSFPKLPRKIPRVKLSEAQKLIKKDIGEPDLSPEGEKAICDYVSKKYNSDFVFITHYPAIKRPFYTFPDEEDEKLTLSFDLLGKGVEWVTGGQRINDYKMLVSAIKRIGTNPDNFKIYLDAFKYGMPKEGGFAMGLERMTMQILGLSNVREASLFPRDPERIDLRLKG